MTEAPFGAWVSPITSAAVVGDSLRIGGVRIDAELTYWLEGRPREGGRTVLVREGSDGVHQDLTPAPYDVRSRVHEYGGGAYVVDEGRVWFSNDADRRIHSIEPGDGIRALSPPGDARYADFALDRGRDRIVCVREQDEGDRFPVNAIVAVGCDSGTVRTLVGGRDFYAYPRVSPTGDRLSWIAWDQPDMPWDSAELWVADIDAEGGLQQSRRLAGGEGVSVFQPAWSADGRLVFSADPDGWWNLHEWDGVRVRRLVDERSECGLPLWQFGMSTFALVDDGDVVFARSTGGVWELARHRRADGEVTPLASEWTAFDGLVGSGRSVAFVGGAPDRASAVVRFDARAGDCRVVRAASEQVPDPAYLSRPRHVEFATGDGERAHGHFYPPANPVFRAPAAERPPLIVIGHGGPTGATSDSLRPAIQFWTSRGFAVLDVDYRGSTGYGRAYRERLFGGWGELDVEDCVCGARFLAARGEVDGARLAIRGSSAGGYTALAALTFHDDFSAGASYYGISDLEILAEDTHKFEARYLDRLVGPWPQARERYRARSPIHFTDRLSCPVIFFQGLEDRVVPPNQAERMVEALRRHGLPVAYHAFEEEQHGFRRAETIRHCLESELAFYGEVFGFDPPDASGSPEPEA